MLGNLHWSNSSRFDMLLDVAVQCISNTHQCSSFGIETRVDNPSMSSIGTVARSEFGCYIDEGASIFKNGTAFAVYNLGCRGFGDFDSSQFQLPSSFLGLHATKMFLNSVSASRFKAAACFKMRF
jgi:hypothetical protein